MVGDGWDTDGEGRVAIEFGIVMEEMGQARWIGGFDHQAELFFEGSVEEVEIDFFS